MKTIEGNLDAKGLKIAIILSRFNNFITKALLEGALDSLRRNNASEDDIEVFWVPGAFEIPLIAKKIASSNKYDGIICLSAVIKGGTPHFDYVASEVSKGIASTMLQTMTPISFGVLTTDTIEQAIERAGTKMGNKGFDAAQTVIELANLWKNI